MAWQDIVIAVGNVIFALALIPSLKTKDKPHVATSALNSLVLFTFAFTLFTLDLILSSVVTFLTASMWALLAVQKSFFKQ